MPEKNQFFDTVIEDVTSEGSGVCHLDGFAVFVPDTAIGDKVRVKLVKVLKNYAYGIVDKLIEPSADRIDPDCSVYKKCGGCNFRHISYEAECQIKNSIVENAFKRIAGLTPEFDSFISAEITSRYRNKAQYPLAIVDGKAVCGFYANRSHRLIPVNNCDLQPEIFTDILSAVLDFVNNKKISVYNEENNSGILRHIYLRRGAHSGEIMLCFVVRKDISRQLMPLCNSLASEFPDIKSFVMNINPDKTNVILGNKCVTLLGNDVIYDTMCGNKIEISPLSFYQINTVQAEKLYFKALEYAKPDKNDVVADLYCGAGTIGLSMAEKSGSIVGIEIVPEAVENAKRNAINNKITNASFFAGDAAKVFGELKKNGCSPDIIILDPPRKGCSPETVSLVADASPQKIVMIPCNPSTAARDAKLFAELGYVAHKVCGVDLFPRTKHVECVVLMSRNES